VFSETPDPRPPLDRVVGEPRRLRDVRAGGAEAERRPSPVQRHAAAVAAQAVPVGVRAAEERRILPVLGRDVADLVQAELLALVQVGAAGQPEQEQRRGQRATAAARQVDLIGRGAGDDPGRALLAALPFSGSRP
jgi:hypothetical protein